VVRRRLAILLVVLLAAALFPAAGQTRVESVDAERVADLFARIRAANDDGTREALTEALAAIGSSAVPTIAAEMGRRDDATWLSATVALGLIRGPDAVGALQAELNRSSGTRAMAVLHSLAVAGDTEAPALALRGATPTLAAGPEATAVDFIAGALGPPAAATLAQEIPRRSPDGRVVGLGALGALADESATPFLLAWSRRPAAIDRRSALIALARIGDPRAGGRFIEALDDSDPSVRETAAEGLGYLREARATEALARIARSAAPPSLKSRAVWSLGLIGGDRAVAALGEALKAAGENDRALALQSLGNTGAPSAAAAIGAAAESDAATVALAAAAALAKLPGDNARERLLAACGGARTHGAGLLAAVELLRQRETRAVPCALRRLRDDVERRRGLAPAAEELLAELPLVATPLAAPSLEGMAEEVAAPALQHRLREAARLVRLSADLGDNVDGWISVFDDGTPREVDLAVERLAELRDARAVEPLVRLIGRIEPDRAYRIPAALGAIGGARSVTFLVALVSNPTYRRPALVRARDEAARALVRCTTAPHAAEALRRAFVAERGRFFTPLLAYARMRGRAGIPDLMEMKRLLLFRRSDERMLRHEKANWALRLLRAGREIPLDEIRDVR